MNLSPFAKKVYKIVAKIPLGEVRSYKWVAERAGRPRAFRAVGQILKNNPYLIFIPCHRVVNSNQELGGYSKGVKYKRMLLTLEKRIKWSLENRG